MVSYNYFDSTPQRPVWTVGTLARTAWADSAVFGKPHAMEYDADGSGNANSDAATVTTLTNADISATCTVNLYNITRFVNVCKYYTSLDVYFHTSLVQYPKALNIKLLPQHLKDKITNDFNYWVENEAEEHIAKYAKYTKPEKQLQRYNNTCNNVLKYMNSDDWHNEWNKFLDYSKALDNHHSTDLFKTYPEYLF